jgi:TetR/AcrR family transcriptional regulator
MSKTRPKASAVKAPRGRVSKRVQRSQGRPRREDPKIGADTLILRTCELLRKEPPHKITIAAVARYSGVNPALIRYYFGDRSNLMIAVARHLLNETARAREAPTTPESAERAIRGMLNALIDLHRKYPSFRELVFKEIMNMRSVAARQLFSEVIDLGVARARSTLTLVRGEESTPPENPNVEAALLHMILIGLGESYVSTFKIVETAAGAPIDRDKIDQQFVDFVTKMIVHGIRKEP